MNPDVVTALIVFAGSVVTGILSYIAGRRNSKDTTKRLESDHSGEFKIAAMAEASKFRDDVLQELHALRDDNRLMRSELVQHEVRCDEKIQAAVERSERECEESTNRKLRSQAAQIRAEYDPQIAALKRQLDDMSEPITVPVSDPTEGTT